MSLLRQVKRATGLECSSENSADIDDHGVLSANSVMEHLMHGTGGSEERDDWATFPVWVEECGMRDVAQFFKQQDWLQKQIMEADESGNEDLLVVLHSLYDAEQNLDPIGIEQYTQAAVENGVKKIEGIRDAAVRGARAMQSYATKQKTSVNGLCKKFQQAVRPDLVKESATARNALALVLKHNNYMAEVSAEPEDERSQDDWDLISQQHIRDLENDTVTAMKFQQQLQQTDPSQRHLLYEAVQSLRMNRREDHVLDEFAPKLFNHREHRAKREASMLGITAELHRAKQNIADDLQVMYQACLDGVSANVHEMDSVLERCATATEKATESVEGLSQKHLKCIQKHNDSVVRMRSKLEELRTEALEHNNAVIELKVVKSRLAKAKATTDAEANHLVHARAAAQSARQAVGDWQTTAEQRKAQLEQILAESLKKDDLMLKDVMEEEAINVKVALAVLERSKKTLQREADQCAGGVDELEVQRTKVIKSGGNSLNVKATLGQLAQRKKELLARREAASQRLQKAAAREDAAREQWDKLLQSGFVSEMDKAKVEAVADALANKCYDSFKQELWKISPQPSDPYEPALGESSDSTATSSTAITPVSDMQAEMERMRRQLFELSNEVASYRHQREQQQACGQPGSSVSIPWRAPRLMDDHHVRAGLAADDAMTITSELSSDWSRAADELQVDQ
eukprot:TRINITY_DN10064_c0_g1_i1.p1 TRINITY_DN10064_c0_g1~~TRINITY_DN10064_c0_g1_i1.p1  ORF type:complete len:687 (-),score=151.81 TRINITY_DN10064_c0_g1_i1:233-2293(-)